MSKIDAQNSEKMTSWDKAVKALSYQDRKNAIMWLSLAAVALLGFYAMSIGIALNSTDVPIILTDESDAFVFDGGSQVFAISIAEKPVRYQKSDITASTKESYVHDPFGQTLYFQVTGTCDPKSVETEEQFGYGLEITFSTKASAVSNPQGDVITPAKTRSIKKCVDPNMYIVVGDIEESFWDGTWVNGFQQDEWDMIYVPPIKIESIIITETNQ